MEIFFFEQSDGEEDQNLRCSREEEPTEQGRFSKRKSQQGNDERRNGKHGRHDQGGDADVESPVFRLLGIRVIKRFLQFSRALPLSAAVV